MDSRSQTLIFVFIHYQKCRTYGFRKLDIFICIFTSECISLMEFRRMDIDILYSYEYQKCHEEQKFKGCQQVCYF